MNCEDYTELLSARLDGELTPEEEKTLEDHLNICPECRAVAEDLARIHLSFEDLEPVPAPENFTREVMEKIEGPKVVPLFRRPGFKAAAGLAACLVLCVGLWQGGMFRQEQDIPAEARAGVFSLTEENTCTLRALPEGTGLERESWTTREDGSKTLLLSTEQLENVEKLAEEQGIELTYAPGFRPDEPVLLVLAP